MSAVPAMAFYGYKGSLVLQSQPGHLFDITKYITEFATGVELQPTKHIVKTRSKKARDAHVNKLMDNIHTVFDYALHPVKNWSFQLARASKHMIDEGFTKEEYLLAINYINDSWEVPLEANRFQATVLDQFLPDFKE
jgi:hypothetical protein